MPLPLTLHRQPEPNPQKTCQPPPSSACNRRKKCARPPPRRAITGIPPANTN